MTTEAAERRAADVAAAALSWYDAAGRDLAFRRSSNAWAVLVSEVMAQQTQAERAATAWTVFIGRYPTPAALAAATAAEVIRAWRGLGYNRRAVALRAAAIRIVEDHDGRVPDSLEALQRLPGIGPYTARAVLAIAFGRRVAALDTNIERVLDRSMGALPASSRDRQAVADGYVSRDRPAAWTHALMDIGATFCHKREPRCDGCPLAGLCALRLAGVSERAGAGGGDAWSKGTAPTPRFETTNRWLRGRILDRLRDAPEGDWSTFDAPMGTHDAASVLAALTDLAHEGLVEPNGSDRTQARLAGAG